MKKRTRIRALLLSGALALSLFPAPAAALRSIEEKMVAKVGVVAAEPRDNNAELTLTGWRAAADSGFQVDYTITNPGGEEASSLFAVLNYSTAPMETYDSSLRSLDAGWEVRFFDVTLQAGETVSTTETDGVEPWRTRIFGNRLLDGSAEMAVIWFADTEQAEHFRRELDWFQYEKRDLEPNGETYVDEAVLGKSKVYTLSYTEHNREYLSHILSVNSAYEEKSETMISPVEGMLEDITQLNDYRTDLVFDYEEGKERDPRDLSFAILLPAGTAVRSMTSGVVTGKTDMTDGVYNGGTFNTSMVGITHESGLVFRYYGIEQTSIPSEFYGKGTYAEPKTTVSPGRYLAEIAEDFLRDEWWMEDDILLEEPGLYLRITSRWAPEYTESLEKLAETGVLTWKVYAQTWSQYLDPTESCTPALLANLRNGVTDGDPEWYDTYNQSRMEVIGYVPGVKGGSLAIRFTNGSAGVDAGGCVYMLAGIVTKESSLDDWVTPPDWDKYYPMESLGFRYRLEPGESATVYLPVDIAITSRIVDADGTPLEGAGEALAWARSPQLLIGRAETAEEYESVSAQVLNSSYGSLSKVEKTIDFRADYAVLGSRLEFQETLYDVFGAMLPQ